MRSKEEIHKDIAYQEQVIATASERVRQLKLELTPPELSQNQILADVLHGLLCHYNHIDGCGYEYEKWGYIRPGGTKSDWLRLAMNVRNFASTQGISIGRLTDLLRYTMEYRRARI